jgi:DNA-directed RNA polymerase subunit RPC12/RpoP
MCLRNPGYVWYETSEACKFFKEKKMASTKKEKLPTVRCPYCNVIINNSGGTWCAKTEWVNIKCSKCNKPVLLSATSAEKREDTPLAVEGSGSLETVEGSENKMSEVPKSSRCVNCGRVFKTTLAVKGGAEPVCAMCRKKEEKPATLGGNLVECGSCGKRRFMEVFRVPGVEGYTCAQCVERLKKDRPIVMSVSKIEEVVKETPIHERFLVVEGRSCGSAWVSTYVYTHPTQEAALVAIAACDPRDGQTCKLLRISSSAPIELEELSLGYDIKVVKKVKR